MLTRFAATIVAAQCAALIARFCNGPWVVNPFFHLRHPFAGSRFCTGSARWPPPDGVRMRIGRPIYGRVVEPQGAMRPDLIHRPGVGTSLREGWCHDPPESPVSSPSWSCLACFLSPIPLFDRDGPFLRPDLTSAHAPRAGTVKDGRRPPPEAARNASFTVPSTALPSRWSKTACRPPASDA